MGGLLHLVQWVRNSAEPQPAQTPPRCTKSHPSKASVPITVLPYNDPLFSGLDVPGLTFRTRTMSRMFANISKAGVESEPRLFQIVGWRVAPPRRTDDTGQTDADSSVVEDPAWQHGAN